MPAGMNRRQFVKTAATGVAAASVLGAARPEAKRPNILFVMTDQEPTSCLACYGNKLIKTPARDAIAEGGIRFSNHYTASYACSPSRATMITGRYTHNHRVYQNEVLLKDSVPALGGILAAEGYDTLWIGKSHLGGDTVFRPGEEHTHRTIEPDPVGIKYGKAVGGGGEDSPIGGFERCVGGWKHYRAWLKTRDVNERLKNDGWVGNHNCLPSGPDSEHAYSRLGDEAHMARFLADTAIENLGQFRKSGKPFCMVLSFYAPHTPVAPPKPWDTMYSLDDIELPPNFRADLSDKAAGQRSTREPKGLQPWWTEEQFKDYIRRYYGYVTYIDGHLLRVLDALEKNGQADDTIIVFTSDHGDMIGQFGMVRKHGNNGYDTLMKVPCMMRWPGKIAARQVEDGLTSSVDLLPTLLDLAGVPAPPGVDGKSMKKLLTEGGPLPRGAVFIDVVNKCYVMREGPWKLTLNATTVYGHPGRDIDELYNMDDDPWEMDNLARKPGHRERVEAMTQRILAWLEETGHPYHRQIRAALKTPVPTCEPFEPVLASFEHLGGPRFRFTYDWRCKGELPAVDGSKDVFFVRDDKRPNGKPLAEGEQPTQPARNEWQKGETYRGAFESALPDSLEPGYYTIWLGMRLPKGRPRFQSGFQDERPIAKLIVSNYKGVTRFKCRPYLI